MGRYLASSAKLLVLDGAGETALGVRVSMFFRPAPLDLRTHDESRWIKDYGRECKVGEVEGTT